MADDEPLPYEVPPYDVGYGKPPKQHQFKKGQSGNPRGRPRKSEQGTVAINAILEQPIRVRVGQKKMKNMQVFEAGVRSLVSQAIKDQKVAAAIRFFELCEKHELIAQPTPGGVISLTIPKDYDYHKWLEMLKTYGPPPWPGEHNGLPKSKQVSSEPTAPERPPNPLRKRPRSNKRQDREILLDIAAQKHWVTEEGKRSRLSVLEMVLMVLKRKAAEAHPRAMRFHDRICAHYGVQAITRIGLIVPEELTVEEWEERFAKPKPNSAA